MIGETYVGVFLLGTAVAAAVSLGRNRSRAVVWEAAAAAAGLERVTVRRRLGWPTALEAHRNGLSVELRASWSEHRQGGTQIQIGGLLPYLGIKVAASPLVDRVVGARDIAVGDDAFDRAIAVHGEPSCALAVLDTEARRRLLALFDVVPRPEQRLETIRESAELASGRLGVFCRDGPRFGRAERLTRCLDEIVALAERLRTPVSIDAALGANAVADALPGVRLRNLAALQALSPDAAATRAVLARAQDDPDEAVALRAALALGPDGHPALRRVAHADGTSEDGFLRAVGALGESWSADDAEHVLARSSQAGRDRVVASCLATLAAAGGAHVETVVLILAAARGERALSAARALGGARAAEAEPALLAALAHEDAPVRVVAAHSLGLVGTVRSVPVLRDAESAGDRTLRRTARAAVASIQSRLVGAERGQLAVAADAGELSLAADPAGRVSLKEQP